MEVSDVPRALARNWWIVAGATVVALGMAVTQVMFAVPQYVTSLTFFVTEPGCGAGNSYQSDLFSQQRVKSYVSVLIGDRLARMVAAGNVGLSAPEIQRRTSDDQQSGQPAVNVDVVAGPTLAAAPVEPRPVRSLAVAGLLGLLAGAAGAVLRDRLDADVLVHADVPVRTGAGGAVDDGAQAADPVPAVAAAR